MDTLEDARQRFADADWGGARDAFSAALEISPGDPEVLDGLGQALWWLGERDEAIARRREAYAAFQARGDARRAGGVAAYLAGEARIDGQEASAAGWLARARRLLAEAAPCPELGWLAIEDAKRAADAPAAEGHARTALGVAHELADPNIECMALAQLGRALVRQGRVDEGLTFIDEAMTVALGGETSDPLACGDACCTTLVVCDGLADLDRAAEWCEAVVEFNERRRFTPVQSWCRGIYASVLLRCGEWERAERVLGEALRERADRRRGGGRALPIATLATLRIRQGRREEAATLLEGLEGEPVAIPAFVELELARGELELARAMLGAAPALEAHVVAPLEAEIALADADLEEAERAVSALSEAAESLSRDDLRAESALLAGQVALAREANEEATTLLAAAVERFAGLRFPLEEARAGLALARAQAATGSPLALAGARAARDRFDRLGARQDADRAAALLRELGVAGRSTTRGERDELTRREREVLALIAEGLSNAEIAERLVIAPKTAEHHVGRVLSKLGVRSRAEAAAHAVREGL